jgi:hypothetical protein
VAEECNGDQTSSKEDFGDNICVKKKNVLRCGFLNIGGLTTQGNSLKDDLLRKGINVYNFDVFGVAETNVDWQLLGEQDRLYMRTKEWWETSHLNFTHNRVSPPLDKCQWGGSALFSLNQAAHRVVDKGWDPTNMGRWCWTKFRGRNDHCLRIFSAYCPNPPSGPGSVATLQRTVMLARQDFRDPRMALIQDLDKEVSEVIKNGELVIIMLDGNSDMRNSSLATMLSNLNLREVILQCHGRGVSTFWCNNSAIPINGIWASAGISVIEGGYLDYEKVVPGADHKCLWTDISFQQAFGHNMPAINRPQTRPLHCKDPRIVPSYNRTYNCCIVRQKVEKLAQGCYQGPSIRPT